MSENVNYREDPENIGEIIPDYRPGHGNEPKYPHNQEEIPHEYELLEKFDRAQKEDPNVVSAINPEFVKKEKRSKHPSQKDFQFDDEEKTLQNKYVPTDSDGIENVADTDFRDVSEAEKKVAKDGIELSRRQLRLIGGTAVDGFNQTKE